MCAGAGGAAGGGIPFQGVKYLATRDDKYLLYGPTNISVHAVTGECRFLSA